MFREIGPQLLAAGRLHDFADPIDIDAVFPAITRIEEQWQPQSRVLATDYRRQAFDLLIAHDVCAPELVAEASRVREQVAQGNGLLRCSGARLTIGVEAFEHDSLTQFRNHIARGRCGSGTE